MIFRSKFGILGWAVLANTLQVDLPWIFGRRVGLLGEIDGILMPLLLLMLILTRFYVYWIVDQESIHEYRFWKRKVIPMSDLMQVSGRHYWNGRPTILRIDHFRAGDPPKSGKMSANPADIYGFLSALRRFAPFAAIDISDAQSCRI